MSRKPENLYVVDMLIKLYALREQLQGDEEHRYINKVNILIGEYLEELFEAASEEDDIPNDDWAL